MTTICFQMNKLQYNSYDIFPGHVGMYDPDSTTAVLWRGPQIPGPPHTMGGGARRGVEWADSGRGVELGGREGQWEVGVGTLVFGRFGKCAPNPSEAKKRRFVNERNKREKEKPLKVSRPSFETEKS